ncbi:MAG: MATE family efflux transporter [Butyricicoccus sp.]|nr:MATE family efflux transporter [Butyricicoccus sp.]
MNNRSEERLGTEPLGKLIFSLAIPALMAQLVNLLYSLVDKIYIGHIADVGALALTGLGLCTPIILIVSAFAAFAGYGGAPLAAMELGRGDREKASRILSMSCVMILFFSVVLTVLLIQVKRPLLYFFGASDDTIGFSEQYLSVYLCGTIFVQAALGLNSFISCQGQAKIAMLSIMIGAASNIVLDPIFIFLFGMGVRGAALATIISQCVSAAWVLRFLLSEKSAIRITPAYMKPDFRIIGRIASLGVSPFIMQSTECLISIVFTSGLQNYGGDLYVGSYTILQSVMQLVFIPTQGFCGGTQAIISYNYGAGNFGRVKKNLRIVTGISLAYTLGFYAFIAAFPRLIAGMFTDNAALLALAAEKLPLFMAGMSIFAFQLGAQTTLMGMGRAKASLFLACLRKIILLTPLALILPRLGLGVDGIYAAEPISDAISALTSLVLVAAVSRKYLSGPAPEKN